MCKLSSISCTRTPSAATGALRVHVPCPNYGVDGSFQKSAAQVQTPLSTSIMSRTPTKRTPKLCKQPHDTRNQTYDSLHKIRLELAFQDFRPPVVFCKMLPRPSSCDPAFTKLHFPKQHGSSWRSSLFRIALPHRGLRLPC